MGLLGDDTEGLFSDVYSLVKQWKPSRDYKDEDEYRDDLVRFLLKMSKNPRTEITKESGRSLADVAIKNSLGRIGIELKLNFHKSSEHDRLIGQLSRYAEEYDGIIVCLVGKTDPLKFRSLRAKLKDIQGKYDGNLFGSATKYFGLVDKQSDIGSDSNKNNKEHLSFW